MTTLAEVNKLSREAFIATFGDVAEHSPWVASEAYAARPFASPEALAVAFCNVLKNAPRAAQLALLRAHPDLATRVKLTGDSTREQAAAGLDNLSSEEFAHFTRLNDLYKLKFGFPFILAVKGATRHQILTSFEQRVNNSDDDEFAMAFTQVCRIFRFRIEDRVAP